MILRSKSKIIVLLACCFAFGIGIHAVEAASWFDGLPKGCKTRFLGLKKKPGWKGFAISNIYQIKSGPRQSCGWSAGYASKAAAAKIAIRTCEVEVRRSRAQKLARCRVVATKK